ncbi:MAG: hypothetical protein LBD67_06605 [Candidatus Accumulibacter sp.]|nr:hypothetical protein [Accumulibacter sp.]
MKIFQGARPRIYLFQKKLHFGVWGGRVQSRSKRGVGFKTETKYSKNHFIKTMWLLCFDVQQMGIVMRELGAMKEAFVAALKNAFLDKSWRARHQKRKSHASPPRQPAGKRPLMMKRFLIQQANTSARPLKNVGISAPSTMFDTINIARYRAHET